MHVVLGANGVHALRRHVLAGTARLTRSPLPALRSPCALSSTRRY